MKRIMILAAALLAAVAVTGAVGAQTATDIQLTRAELQQERQKIVAANLGLTEEEGVNFWVLYRDYRVEMARVGDRLVKLITDYAARRDSLTDAEASSLMEEWLSIQTAEVSIRQKYLKKFQKILPMKKAVRFFQIENKMDAAVRYELAGMIPLVR